MGYCFGAALPERFFVASTGKWPVWPAPKRDDPPGRGRSWRVDAIDAGVKGGGRAD
jgi:hypothetical protein